MFTISYPYNPKRELHKESMKWIIVNATLITVIVVETVIICWR